MKLLVRGVHLKLSDDIKAYVEKHLVERLEQYFDDEAAEIDVHLVDTNGPKGGEDKACRVTLRMPGMNTIHIEESAASLKEAVDSVRDRMEKAMKREIAKARQVAGHPTSNPAGRLAPREAFVEGEDLPSV